MHPLSYSLLSLLLAVLSLASSIAVLCTGNPNSTTFPAVIAWLTLSAALVYISLCVLLFTWLQLRKKWNGSQENFEQLAGKGWNFKCDSRSSSEISAGRERSQGTFYWCGESLKRVVREDPVDIPRPPPLRSSRLWPERSSSLLPIPLPPPMLAPASPRIDSMDSNIDVDLTVPSPALYRPNSPNILEQNNSATQALHRSDSTNDSVHSASTASLSSPSRPVSKDSHLTIDVGTASKLSLVLVQASEVQVKTPKTPELRAQIREEMRQRVQEMRGKLIEEVGGKDS